MISITLFPQMYSYEQISPSVAIYWLCGHKVLEKMNFRGLDGHGHC